MLETFDGRKTLMAAVGVECMCVTHAYRFIYLLAGYSLSGESSVMCLEYRITILNISIISMDQILLSCISNTLNTHCRNHCTIKSRVDVRRYLFSQTTINVWNKLSTNSGHASSIMFKKRINTYLSIRAVNNSPLASS